MQDSELPTESKNCFRLVFLLSGRDGKQLLEESLASFRITNPEIKTSIYMTETDVKVQLSSHPAFHDSELILINNHPKAGDSPSDTDRFGDYGTTLFNTRTTLKWFILLDAIKRHKSNIIFSDIDILFLRPLPLQEFGAILEDYDIFIQDEGAETYPKSPCTGFMGFKDCEENLKLLLELNRIHTDRNALQNDQDVFRNALRANKAILEKTYFLSQYLFPVGYLAPAILRGDNSLTLRPKNDPYIFHANWVIGLSAKRSLIELITPKRSDYATINSEFPQAIDHLEPGISTNMFPLVSICTPTHNRAQFLPFLRNCIANQDYPLERIQWVIVDDSTDNSNHMPNLDCKEFDIKYQRIKEKMPLGTKRNLSHRLCDGEIIVYMDDDDYYFPSRVSHSVRRLLGEKGEVAGSTSLFIYFTHINEIWVSGPFDPKHATAGTFAMTKSFARSQRYDANAQCNEERSFLNDYSIPLVQLEPQHTMICISHEANTFDKKKMIANGKTQRIRPLSRDESQWIAKDVNLLAYKDLA